MATKKVLLVPHGHGGSLEDLSYHLSSYSAVLSAFIAVMVRKHPDLKDEVLSVLREMRDTDGVSQQDRSALADAVSIVEMLVTESKYTH